MNKSEQRDDEQARRCMPLAEWPAVDRALWHAALEHGDIIDGEGLRARLRPISNRKVERGYGRWLTFLARRCELDGRHPADRLTPQSVGAYIEEMTLLGNSKQTKLARLQELYDIARCLDLARDWTWLRRVSSQLRRTLGPSREKRSRMVSAQDLVALGRRLMKEAAHGSTQVRAAIAFRDGLLITLLAYRPLRRKNLADLRISETLCKTSTGYRIEFEGDDMKNGTPFDAAWPEALLSELHTWLEIHRPVLLRQCKRWAWPIGDALWVSSHGSPLTQQAIYDRVTKRTREAFGRVLIRTGSAMLLQQLLQSKIPAMPASLRPF